VLSKRIDRLVFTGQRLWLLQNGGGNVNEINFVLSRAAITVRRGQRKKDSKNVVFSVKGINWC
jgi:hypothetical protein